MWYVLRVWPMLSFVSIPLVNINICLPGRTAKYFILGISGTNLWPVFWHLGLTLAEGSWESCVFVWKLPPLTVFIILSPKHETEWCDL